MKTGKIVEQLNDPLVKNICVARCEIGVEDAKAIAKALKTNTALRKLDLSNNLLGIGKGGDALAKAIAKALKTNTTLRVLRLSLVGIGIKGAKAIAEMLKINQTLRELSLSFNPIKDEGAGFIAEALKTNTSLRILLLPFTMIEVEGAKFIAEALRVNKTLRFVSVFNNLIGAEGEKALFEVLKTNATIRDIYFWGGESDVSELRDKVQKQLKINKHNSERLQSLQLQCYRSIPVSDRASIPPMIKFMMGED